MKRVIASFVFGLVLTVVLVWAARVSPTAAIGLLPFYMIGVWISGNVHAPNDWVVYGSVFAFFSTLILLLVLVGTYLSGSKGRRD